MVLGRQGAYTVFSSDEQGTIAPTVSDFAVSTSYEKMGRLSYPLTCLTGNTRPSKELTLCLGLGRGNYALLQLGPTTLSASGGPELG